MSDLISIQAAIEAHCELCPDRGSCSDICPDVEVFKLLPSVQERKGRWKSDEEEGDIMCSCCGDWWSSGFETAFHYCPNCGAHMEGVGNKNE